MLNKDIGFVNVGQEAVVKVESFPFTQYGTIKAHVTRVASDAIPEPDASASEGDPRPRRTPPASPAASAPRTWSSRVLEPDAQRSPSMASPAPLTSGMAATVEIKTGARRILEYLFSPLVEVASRAMRER